LAARVGIRRAGPLGHGRRRRVDEAAEPPELVRQEQQRTELSPERRDQIRERVLERVERYEVRRRRWREFMLGVSAVLVTSVAVALVIRARTA